MTDNEIKKALERLKSTKDYLKEQYQEQVKKCTYPELKPIAKQTYEDNKKAFDIAIKAIEEINRLQAENESLQKDSKRLKKVQMQLDDAMKMYFEIKAEAYKEFAEIVKANKHKLFNYIYSSKGFDNQIDNLLKEKVGEDK